MKCYACGTDAKPSFTVVEVDGKPTVAESGPQHPFVGVGREKADLEGTIAANPGLSPEDLAVKIQAEIAAKSGLQEYPICKACQANPKPGLKLHYFAVADAPSARKARQTDANKLGAASIASESVASAPGSN